MSASPLEPLVDGVGFAEGLSWRDGALWFSDFCWRTVESVVPGSAAERRAFFPGQPSGLGFRPDGVPLVVSMYDRCLVALEDGAPGIVADLTALTSGPCNDLVVDANGRAYISLIGYPPYLGRSAFQPAPLLVVHPDGSASVACEPLHMPNGMAFSPDGALLVVAETLGSRLSVFDVARDGSLSRRRTYAVLDERTPDGICMDVDGGVWVADAAGSEFVRVDEHGRVTDVVDAGGGHAIACALGGDDLRTLFCSIAADRPDVPGIERAGAIRTVRVPVAGVAR